MNGISKAVTALLLVVITASATVLAYAALNYRQISEYEIADTIDVRYTPESGELYQLGTLIVNETYTFLLNDSYTIKVYRFAGTLDIALTEINASRFDYFNISLVNLTDQSIVQTIRYPQFNAMQVQTNAEQEYGYIFEFKVAEDVEDAVTGTVEIDVDFFRA